jgi:hypothetical protein
MNRHCQTRSIFILIFMGSFFYLLLYYSLYRNRSLNNISMNIKRKFKIYVYDIDPKLRIKSMIEGKAFQPHILMFNHSQSQYMLSVLLDSMFRSCPERTQNPEEANLFFIPFYDVLDEKKISFSYSDAMEKIFSGVTNNSTQNNSKWIHLWNKIFTIGPKYFIRNKGMDHVVSVSRPFWSIPKRYRLEYNPIFITLEYDSRIKRHVEKNIVVPYPINDPSWIYPTMVSPIKIGYEHSFNVIESFLKKRRDLLSKNNMLCDSKDKNLYCVTSDERPILLYLSGSAKAGKGIRQKLIIPLLKNEKTCPLCLYDEIDRGNNSHPETGYSLDDLKLKMSKSVFCIVPQGDSATSRRLYNALMTGCIPVVISDLMVYPFERRLNYTELVIWPKEKEAYKLGILRSIEKHLLNQYESLSIGVVSMRNKILNNRHKWFYIGDLQLNDLIADTNANPVLKQSKAIPFHRESAYTMILDELEMKYSALSINLTI